METQTGLETSLETEQDSAVAVEMVESIITESDGFVEVEQVEEEEEEELPDLGAVSETYVDDSISSEAAHVVKPVPQVRPPPDLRFEESYLRAISAADGKWWKIAYITIRDQVFMPLVQGTIWSFLLLSASSLRAKSSGSGRYYGSSVVRWWRSINPPNGKH
ncbi:hypothetical protein CKK34_2405 [Yarrowia sp. E02]|nr:hypothetical protein CKK34_2405 [Yarrowia sp. E02]